MGWGQRDLGLRKDGGPYLGAVGGKAVGHGKSPLGVASARKPREGFRAG